jgi:hypothetical protein
MPFVYDLALATPASSTTNGSANTESSVFTAATVTTLPSNSFSVFAMYVQGKAAAATSITGLAFRMLTLTTASATAGGTQITPRPATVGGPAALAVVYSAVTTIGATGRTNHVIFGCGAAGPGGWVAGNPDAMLTIRPTVTNAASIDVASVSAGTSLAFEWSAQMQEY